jgi:hypothetical protein
LLAVEMMHLEFHLQAFLRINAAISEVRKQNTASAVEFKKKKASILRLAIDDHDGDKNDYEVIDDKNDPETILEDSQILTGRKRLRKAGVQDQSSSDDDRTRELAKKEALRASNTEWMKRWNDEDAARKKQIKTGIRRISNDHRLYTLTILISTP